MKAINLGLVLIVAAFLFSFKIGSYPLLDVDEPRYAEAAREMVETGDYTVPRLNYNDRYDKPVLFYWEEALSYKIFGVNEFAARLPSVLAGLGMIILAFVLGNVHGAGLISSIVMGTSLQIIGFSRLSITDMSLSFFISAALVFFYLAYNDRVKGRHNFGSQKRKSSFWLYFAFVAMALGTLCKGPVAILIPGIVVVPFLWWQKDLKAFFQDTQVDLIIGGILLSLIVLPWYSMVHLATDGGFTKSFFFHHNFTRFTDTVSNHFGSWWFYFVVIFAGFAPWSIFLLQSLWSAAFADEPYKSNDRTPQQLMPFCLWWFFAVLLFFTLAGTKVISYILPVYTPLAVIMGKWWSSKFNLKRNDITKNSDAFLGFLLLLVGTSIAFYLAVTQFGDFFESWLGKNFFMPLLIMAGLVISCTCIALTAIMKKPKISFAFLTVATLCVYFIGLETMFIPHNINRQTGIKTFIQNLEPDSELVTYGTWKPSMTFYAQKKIEKLPTRTFVETMKDKSKKVYFITRRKYLNNVDKYVEKIQAEKIQAQAQKMISWPKWKVALYKQSQEKEKEQLKALYQVISEDKYYVYGSN